MKSDSYLRLCLLVAGGKFSERELFDIAEHIRNSSVHALSQDISHIRAMVGNPKRLTAETRLEDDVDSNYRSDVENKVTRLLVAEAGLTRGEAGELITSALRRRHPNPVIPSHHRKNFGTWLAQLATIFSPSEILFIATTIRNDRVHQLPPDWQLK